MLWSMPKIKKCKYCDCQSCYRLHLSRYYLKEKMMMMISTIRFGRVRKGVDNSYMIDLTEATSPILKHVKTTIRKKRPHHSLNSTDSLGQIFYKRRDIAKPRWEEIKVNSAVQTHSPIIKWKLSKKRKKDDDGKEECDTTHVCQKNCTQKHNEYHVLSNITPPIPPSSKALIESAMSNLVNRERGSTDPFTSERHNTNRSIALDDSNNKSAPYATGWKKVNKIKQ